jgi:hypothetical protein
MTPRQRRATLFVILVAAAAWSAWLAIDDDGTKADTDAVIQPRDRRSVSAAPAKTTARPLTVTEPAIRLGPVRSNLFPAQTWYFPPPPPPPPPYVPPPPPQAPTLPFSYMGRWQEAGQTTYFLMRGSMPLSVRTGQVVGGVWRLETVEGSTLNFTYLPLNQTRSLRTGD